MAERFAYDPVVMGDREFSLLVAACRATFAGEDVAATSAAADGIDWPRLLAMATRHRVEALAWHSLGPLDLPVPKGIAAEFSARAAAIVASNLRSALECAALARAFTAAGIDLLFVKGLTLGTLAYGTPYLKMGLDIDLLVSQDRIADAVAVLTASGYAPTEPASPITTGRLVAWHRQRKETAWHQPEGDFYLDLHGRLSDHHHLIAGIGMASPRQSVMVAPGIELPTLNRDELFAYLCVHGASSAWFRLKWITDVAALLHGADEHELDRLHARSQQLGAGRTAGQAMLLADRLYQIPLSAPLRAELARDPAVRWLADVAFTQLAGRRDLKEPTERRFGTVTIRASQLVLVRGWRPLLSELGRQVGDVLTPR